MSAMADSCDVEVNSHIQHFLDRLPGSLRLERVLELTLKDPQAALAVLLDVKRAVEAEQRKAQALYQLSQIQAACSDAAHLDPVVPVVESRVLM